MSKRSVSVTLAQPNKALALREEKPLILEGIVTTRNEDGSVNISPMGPIVDEQMRHFTLRPFQTSQTYQNLKARPSGVLHVTDDAMLIARSAIGCLDELPAMTWVETVDGFAIDSACRWYAFRVESIDDSQPRTTIKCQVVETRRQRDFFGFNRGKHAVIEAAILATRIGILADAEICEQFAGLEIIVGKTGGAQETAAFALLKTYVGQRLAVSAESAKALPHQDAGGRSG